LKQVFGGTKFGCEVGMVVLATLRHLGVEHLIGALAAIFLQ